MSKLNLLSAAEYEQNPTTYAQHVADYLEDAVSQGLNLEQHLHELPGWLFAMLNDQPVLADLAIGSRTDVFALLSSNENFKKRVEASFKTWHDKHMQNHH